jgi:adenylosuccinate lyase
MQFLLADSILIGLDNVTDGLIVFPAIIEAQLQQELPFMATVRAQVLASRTTMY